MNKNEIIGSEEFYFCDTRTPMCPLWQLLTGSTECFSSLFECGLGSLNTRYENRKKLYYSPLNLAIFGNFRVFFYAKSFEFFLCKKFHRLLKLIPDFWTD